MLSEIIQKDSIITKGSLDLESDFITTHRETSRLGKGLAARKQSVDAAIRINKATFLKSKLEVPPLLNLTRNQELTMPLPSY